MDDPILDLARCLRDELGLAPLDYYTQAAGVIEVLAAALQQTATHNPACLDPETCMRVTVAAANEALEKARKIARGE